MINKLFFCSFFIFINLINSKEENTHLSDEFYPCHLSSLIDGEEYFTNLYEHIQNSKNEILFVGWRISPALIIYNRGTSQNITLLQAFESAIKRNVKVYIEFWDNIVFSTFKMFDLNVNENVEILRKIGAKVTITTSINILWMQHMKFVVFDRKIAFIGGIDASLGRWDTSNHIGNDSRRIDFEKNSVYNKNRMLYRPWHDVSVKIETQAINDLIKTFVQRWDKSCYLNFFLKECKSNERPLYLNKNDLYLYDKNIKYEENCKVVRSISYWSAWVSPTENEIYKSYIWMIENSEKYLYFENQYQQSAPTSHNKLSLSIINRIKKAIKEMKHFKAFILKPLTCDIEDSVIGMKKTLFMGKDAIVESIENFIKEEKNLKNIDEKYKLWLESISWEDYISVNFLGSVNINKETMIAQFRQIYLHAKLFIVDDKYVNIGSANWNDRSLDGSRDSETNLFIKPNETEKGILDGEQFLKGIFAKKFRLKLWNEHLGIYNNNLLEDPVSFDVYNKTFNYIANKNIDIIREIFDFKSENMRLSKDFPEIILKVWESNINYEQLKQLENINGHLFRLDRHMWGDEEKDFFNAKNLIPFYEEMFK